MEKINLPPNPSSLAESMRDIGYSIETAIADVIDNSITAEAKTVDVRFSWDNGNPWLAIIDDGYGMVKDELISAMRFGSSNPLEKRDKNDLGRFGLGLKTASFSQCRCLVVISKKENVTSGVKWDLDLIAQSADNDWILSVLNEDEVNSISELFILREEYLARDSEGTIVFWQKMDRLESGLSKQSQEIKFNESINSVRQHLELVFHRFLLPDIGKSKVNIFFNKDKIEAFDPFNSAKSVELRKEEFLFENESIYIQPYILPHHNKVTKLEWEKYAGKQGYLHEQGFYVYRNRRLIISATWFRMLRKEELTKLLRVRIDIPNSLDSFWHIDVKKSHATPPVKIRDELKRIIGKIEFSGKQVYKQRGQRLSSEVKFPAWERIAKDNQIYYQINREHPLLMKYVDNLDEKQRSLFNDIISTLESSFPRESFYSDTASTPENVAAPTLDKSQILALIEMFLGDSQAESLKWSSINAENLSHFFQLCHFLCRCNIAER
ncbi:MAG: ATP-binding protein [Methylophaga sp.]|nr:MAG: ATP-binding protein [Methylophaga sp.]